MEPPVSRWRHHWRASCFPESPFLTRRSGTAGRGGRAPGSNVGGRKRRGGPAGLCWLLASSGMWAAGARVVGACYPLYCLPENGRGGAGVFPRRQEPAHGFHFFSRRSSRSLHVPLFGRQGSRYHSFTSLLIAAQAYHCSVFINRFCTV